MSDLKTNLAKHFHQVYFGGNWAASSFVETIKDISYEDATKTIDEMNSIAVLSFHIHYYVRSVMMYLEGNEFKSSDKDSFLIETIKSESDWEDFKLSIVTEGERFSFLLDKQNDLDQLFIKEDYGSKYRNFHGIIEHTHYHLGQIVLLKKLLVKKN